MMRRGRRSVMLSTIREAGSAATSFAAGFWAFYGDAASPTGYAGKQSSRLADRCWVAR